METRYQNGKLSGTFFISIKLSCTFRYRVIGELNSGAGGTRSPLEERNNPNWKSYLLSKPEKEFHVMEEMYAASQMRMSAEKTTFLGKDD